MHVARKPSTGHTREEKKKKAVSPSVHCTYSSMNVKKKKNGTLLSSKGGGKDNLPASHPYFKIKTKEVPTFRGNVKHLFSRAYCGTYFFFLSFFLFTYLECCFGKSTKVRHNTKRKSTGTKKKKKMRLLIKDPSQFKMDATTVQSHKHTHTKKKKKCDC